MTPPLLEEVLTDVRRRFVAGFRTQCDSIAILVDHVGSAGRRGPVGALQQVTHRLTGLAGTIGFPTVSARAADLEALIGDGSAFDYGLARAAVKALGEAFVEDAANSPGLSAGASAAAAKILLVEDEPDCLAIMTASLEACGYAVVPVTAGDLVLEAVRREKPALILLDIVLPRLDGYSVCRLLKADPELAAIPVILMTAGGATLDDRLVGLTLGADEFLTKPVDMQELIVRIQIALDRARARGAQTEVTRGATRELTYDAFLAVGIEAIARMPVAVAMVRLPIERHGEAAILLVEDLRGRDVLGTYDLTRILILLPETTAAAARDRLGPIVDRLVAHGLTGACIGVTAAIDATKSLETLIGEADEALAEARYLGRSVAIWTEPSSRAPAAPAARTVVVAEDDPDVTRILDAQLRGAGYHVFAAIDGEQALAAVRAHAPDVVVLDLVMPKVDGFEVLRQLRAGPEPRPRVIVVSGRGREADVLRAFSLGADDYMTKPFNPRELMARLTRVLK